MKEDGADVGAGRDRVHGPVAGEGVVKPTLREVDADGIGAQGGLEGVLVSVGAGLRRSWKVPSTVVTGPEPSSTVTASRPVGGRVAGGRSSHPVAVTRGGTRLRVTDTGPRPLTSLTGSQGPLVPGGSAPRGIGTRVPSHGSRGTGSTGGPGPTSSSQDY